MVLGRAEEPKPLFRDFEVARARLVGHGGLVVVLGSCVHTVLLVALLLVTVLLVTMLLVTMLLVPSRLLPLLIMVVMMVMRFRSFHGFLECKIDWWPPQCARFLRDPRLADPNGQTDYVSH